MKKRTVLSVCLSLVAAAAAMASAPLALGAGLNTGAGPWQWVMPDVQGTTINDISFINDNTGWAVGQGGTIIKTTDGGANWTAQNSGTTYNLEGVDFIDANTGWIAGNFGTYGSVVLKTTDGGTNWTSQTLPASAATAILTDVDFISSTRGVAIGSGKVYYTSNGGTTWTQATGVDTNHNLQQVQLLNTTTGYAVGQTGSIYKTTNGGAAWTQQTNGVPGGVNAYGLYFKDVNNGIVVGSTGSAGRVLKTDNGGVTWIANNTGPPTVTFSGGGGTGATATATVTGDNVTSVAVTNGGSGYSTPPTVTFSGSSGTGATATATLTGGVVTGVTVTNGGSGYTIVPVNTPFMDVSASSNGNTIIAAGNDGNIYYYDATNVWSQSLIQWAAGLDGGARDSGAKSSIQEVQFTSETVAYAGGEAGLISKSEDVGGSWQRKAGGDAFNLVTTSFVDADNGWAAGDDGRIYKTTDGGDTWASDNSGIPTPADFQVNDIHFLDTNTGFAVGCRGASCPDSGTGEAYKYNSGTWSSMSVPGGVVVINDVHMVDATSGWAVGADGVALRTSDGSNWALDNTGIAANYELNSVDSITAATNAWAVGNNTSTGKAVYATYSGGSWTVSGDFPSSSFFVGIDMVDASTGYFVGSGGAVYKTTNGGGIWTQQTSGTSKLLAGVSFINDQYGFAVGEDGRIIHTTDGGASWGAENLGTNVSFFDVSAVGERQAFIAGGNGSVMKALRSYFYTWYDDSGGDNWVLMANPISGTGDLWFDLFIAGTQRSLASYNNGQVATGSSIAPRYTNVIGGPVNTSSLTSQKAVVSQRILWPNGGSSIEEVLGMDVDRLSSHYYWTWYDGTGGFQNWVLVANPNPFTVYYRIKIAGTVRASGTIAAGKNITPQFAGVVGGPVEVEAWNDAVGGSNPADVFASQRVLSNGGLAFNEAVGVPAEELTSRYVWTWYDNLSPGARNWVLIANPEGSGSNMHYEVVIGGEQVMNDTAGGLIAPGQMKYWTFSKQDGPVEVKTFSDTGHGVPMNSIASQRITWGSSFGETMGYPFTSLSDTYHWTWYDQTSGLKNWVLIGNPSEADTAYYEIDIGDGCDQGPAADRACLEGSITPAQKRAIPTFNNVRGGPVQVKAWSDAGHTVPMDVITSQRVLYNNYFNEVVGTVLD